MDDDLNRVLINPLPTVSERPAVRFYEAGAVVYQPTSCQLPRCMQFAHWQPMAALQPTANPVVCVQGVKLHAIIDACHSGSVMDLPFQVSFSWSFTWVLASH